MELFYIILLIFFGLLFLVAELVLLPGVTVGAALALLCDGCAIWLAFRDFGTGGGAAAIVAVLLLSLLVTVVSLRAKTWQRFSLHQTDPHARHQRRKPQSHRNEIEDEP